MIDRKISVEDGEALASGEKFIRTVNGHFQIGLP